MVKRSKGREWTKDDVRELKTLARQKTPAAKIAKSLKRTPGATRQKAVSGGFFAILPSAFRRCGNFDPPPQRGRNAGAAATSSSLHTRRGAPISPQRRCVPRVPAA